MDETLHSASQEQTQPDPLNGMLCFAVYSAQLAFNRLYNRILDKFGLTYLQYLVLIALSGVEQMTVGELNSRLSLESSTLTPMLKRMEAAGLVTRRRSEADERVVILSLSDRGQQLAKSVSDAIPQLVRGAVGLSAQEAERMEEDLLRLGRHLRNA